MWKVICFVIYFGEVSRKYFGFGIFVFSSDSSLATAKSIQQMTRELKKSLKPPTVAKPVPQR